MLGEEGKLSTFSKEDQIIGIQPSYRMHSGMEDVFLKSVQMHLPLLLPSFFIEELSALPKDANAWSLFQRLHAALPAFSIASFERTAQAYLCSLEQGLGSHPSDLPNELAAPFVPQAFPVLFLCPAQFAHGVERYIKDTLGRWLIPGRQIPIVGEFGLSFSFTRCPEMKFLFVQHLIGIQSRDEKKEILKNIYPILNEMKLNIKASFQANYIISIKSYSKSYKSLLIQNGLSSLLNRFDDSLYEQIQMLVSQRASEEKVQAIQSNLGHLLQMRPKIFDRNIFYEMTRITALIHDQFESNRESKSISRLIAHYYLFKKFVESKVKNAPQQRHLSLKITPVRQSGGAPVVSILIVMNFLSDSERFDQKNIVDATRACGFDLICIDKSFLSDRREGNILFMYAEFVKRDEQAFSMEEIRGLKSNLPCEIIRHIKKVIHPVFMPRNEEELFRNLVLLSKEIKYVRDLPQVSIHYEKQTNDQLIFTVLVVRLKKSNSLCVHQIFSAGALSVEIDDTRILGQLKRRYPKESAILRVSIEKSLFFRPDFSVDLLRARHRVASEIARALGEFRDFNGGMIIKQEELLSELRKLLSPLTREHEFLLENYFYSLRPVIAQTIHDPSVLKPHFEMLLNNIEFNESSMKVVRNFEEKYELWFLFSIKKLPEFNLRKQLSELQKDPHALTSCSIGFDHMTAIGFIFKKDRPDLAKKIEQFIEGIERVSAK